MQVETLERKSTVTYLSRFGTDEIKFVVGIDMVIYIGATAKVTGENLNFITLYRSWPGDGDIGKFNSGIKDAKVQKIKLIQLQRNHP